MLTVETGSGVAGANTYVSLADAQAFIDARELSVTLTDGLLLRAMDALSTVRLKGYKTNTGNPLPMPRTSLYDNEGSSIASNVVPQQIINAQIWLAYYIEQGNDPSAVSEPAISSETVDVISVDYAVNAGATTGVSVISLPNVRDSLRGLIVPAGMIDRG